MRVLEQRVCNLVPSCFGEGLLDAVFRDLRTSIEVRLADDIGHLGFDDLESIVFEVSFDIVVRARVEIQQVFAHDEHARSQVRSVVLNCAHNVDSSFEAALCTRCAMMLEAEYDLVESALECFVSRSRYEFVWAHLAQQLFEGVDHGKAHGDSRSRGD